MRSEGSGARMSAISRSWWFERKVRTPLNPLTIAAIGPLNQDELVGDTL